MMNVMYIAVLLSAVQHHRRPNIFLLVEVCATVGYFSVRARFGVGQTKIRLGERRYTIGLTNNFLVFRMSLACKTVFLHTFCDVNGIVV